MPQPPIIIIQPVDQLLLTLFRLFLFLPRINRLVRQMIIDTAIRTTIKCNHSKCTRLLRLDERKHSLHNANQLCRLFFHTQYSISRQQNGIKLATHHIRIHPEIAIFFQRPGSQGTIFLTHPLHTVITLKSTVQTIQHTVIVQTGISGSADFPGW